MYRYNFRSLTKTISMKILDFKTKNHKQSNLHAATITRKQKMCMCMLCLLPLSFVLFSPILRYTITNRFLFFYPICKKYPTRRIIRARKNSVFRHFSRSDHFQKIHHQHNIDHYLIFL